MLTTRPFAVVERRLLVPELLTYTRYDSSGSWWRHGCWCRWRRTDVTVSVCDAAYKHNVAWQSAVTNQRNSCATVGLQRGPCVRLIQFVARMNFKAALQHWLEAAYCYKRKNTICLSVCLSRPWALQNDWTDAVHVRRRINTTLYISGYKVGMRHIRLNV